MRSRLYFLHKSESSFFKESSRFGQGHYMVYMRSHAAKRFCPVDDEHLAAGLEDALYFLHKTVFVLYLKEHVGGDGRIDGMVFEMGPLQPFDVAPESFDVMDMRFFRMVLQFFKQGLLHLNGVHLARIPHRLRDK